MMNCSRSALGLGTFLFCLAAWGAGHPFLPNFSRAADRTTSNWTHWRGPSGQGYSTDARVPLTWGENQNLLWKTKLQGAGNSSPILWGDRIFLTEARAGGKELWMDCFLAGDGKLLWEKLAARVQTPGKTHDWNGYASPSCTTDGKY